MTDCLPSTASPYPTRDGQIRTYYWSLNHFPPVWDVLRDGYVRDVLEIDGICESVARWAEAEELLPRVCTYICR